MKYTLKELRARKNVSQDYICKQLNISRPNYIRIEKDINHARFGLLLEICKILEVNIEEIK